MRIVVIIESCPNLRTDLLGIPPDCLLVLPTKRVAPVATRDSGIAMPKITNTDSLVLQSKVLEFFHIFIRNSLNETQYRGSGMFQWNFVSKQSWSRVHAPKHDVISPAEHAVSIMHKGFKTPRPKRRESNGKFQNIADSFDSITNQQRHVSWNWMELICLFCLSFRLLDVNRNHFQFGSTRRYGKICREKNWCEPTIEMSMALKHQAAIKFQPDQTSCTPTLYACGICDAERSMLISMPMCRRHLSSSHVRWATYRG